MPWWWPFGPESPGGSGSGRRSPPPPDPPLPVWQGGGDILVSPSRKLHPEIDYEAIARGFIASGLDQKLAGELVTSPYDLFAVETLRDRHGLRTGRAVPTDVFVLGKGEAPRRDATKIGGLPYWPAGRAWPNDIAGRPYRFLAQFNFADSLDLFAGLPGEVLLVFVGHAEGDQRGPDDWAAVEPPAVHLKWLPSGLEPVASVPSELIAYPQATFFGAIHRTADYPDAAETAGNLDVRDSACLPIIYGVKIGGLPHPVQDRDYRERGYQGRLQLLCQLGSIQCAANVPYPWLNEPAARYLWGADAESDTISFMDMGVLYIFRKPDGALTAVFDTF
jgi:hypothetical protein